MLTQKEIRTELERLAKEVQAGIIARAEALPAAAKTEKRALMIARNIAGHCAMFSQYEFNGNFNAVAHRRIFVDHPELFGHVRAAFDAMQPVEQDAFLAYAFPVWMVRYNFHDPRAKILAEVADTDNPDTVFEAKIITAVTEEILAAWERFAHENHIGGAA